MRVYISHSVKERDVALAITARLTNDGHVVFSADDLPPGGNWAQEIASHLARANAMVVLVSPASMKSDFVRKDIEYALSADQFKGRLFPVILRRTSEMPWILNEIASITPPSSATPAQIAAAVSNAMKQSRTAIEKAGA